MSEHLRDGETLEEREVLRRAIQRAQLNDTRGARLHSAARAITWAMVAVLALTAAMTLGWYFGGHR